MFASLAKISLLFDFSSISVNNRSFLTRKHFVLFIKVIDAMS